MANSGGFSETINLHHLRSLLEAVDDAETLAGIVNDLRAIERAVTGLITLAGTRAALLASEGRGAPVSEVLGCDGTVPASTSQAEAARSGLAPRFPKLTAGVISGAVPAANADVLVRIVDRMDEEEIASLSAADEDLARAAKRLPAESFARRVRRARDRIRKDAGHDDAARAKAETGAQVGLTRDRRHVRLQALLPMIEGSQVMSAARSELQRLAATGGLEEGLRFEQQLNEALMSLLLRGAAAPLDTPEAGRTNATVNVLCDSETFHVGAHDDSVTETLDGGLLSPADVGRVCCEAAVRRVAGARDGEVMATVESRTATSMQRAALFALYGGCAITGADWSRVELHHVVFSSDGGKTAIDNLIPITAAWHRRIHNDGWQLEMDADRQVRLHRPDGELHRIIAPPVPLMDRRRTEASEEANVPVAA